MYRQARMDGSLVLSLQRLDVCLAVGLGDHVQKLASFLLQFRLVRLAHRVQYYTTADL